MKSGGVEFESWLKHVTLKTFKMIPTKVMTIVKVWEMHWSINRRNSLPFTVRNFPERFGCLLYICFPYLSLVAGPGVIDISLAQTKQLTRLKMTPKLIIYVFGRGE